MSSFCIKTNDDIFIKYFFSNLSNIKNQKNFIIRKKFLKNYTNIFIHFNGNNINIFYETISHYITDCIIQIYENKILDKLLNINYFYFLDNEQEKINSFARKTLNSSDKTYRNNLIYISITNYLKEGNKSMILDGFIRFRIKDYLEILEYAVDLSVNNFLVEKEYLKFIQLLRDYIHSSKNSETIDLIHIIYVNNSSILMDNAYNILEYSDFGQEDLEIFENINFSANDYALNLLLSILPKKIILHVPNAESKDDEFLKTLMLIFEERMQICKNCNICKFYNNGNIKI